MSFRRDRAKSLQWQQWLELQRDKLIACGIPRIVLDDMSSWYYFLEHGYFTPAGSAEPIINVDHMDKTNAERLCLFLEEDDLYPHSDALNRLHYRLKRGPTQKPSIE